MQSVQRNLKTDNLLFDAPLGQRTPLSQLMTVDLGTVSTLSHTSSDGDGGSPILNLGSSWAEPGLQRGIYSASTGPGQPRSGINSALRII